MNFFYIKHHYQSIVRSNSFGGEIFAFILVSFLMLRSYSLALENMDKLAVTTLQYFGFTETNFSIILGLYILLDMLLRISIRRPEPKLKYYILWKNLSKQIGSQYLLTSLFGLLPYILFITNLIFATKAGGWFGQVEALVVVLWFLANHMIGLASQNSKKRVKRILSLCILVMIAMQMAFPNISIIPLLLEPIVVLPVFLFSTVLAYLRIKHAIEEGGFMESKSKTSILDSIPTLSFKNSIFQLEWALIARNKRTRSNLLMGLISVIVLPFLMDSETEPVLATLIFFIATGFFIIQHGVYSLGWEGSYFDFLLTNIVPKRFIATRYLFYIGTCTIGLLLASIPTIINGLNWVTLFIIFLYNIGCTIPLVLYRSTFNATKIELSENSLMNYSGMMTGPIFVTSFLVMLLPLMLFGVAQGFLGENAIYALGVIGLLGLALNRPIVSLVARKYHRRKYHLSQSFKS